MKYISVAEAAKKWGVSERSVRGYCSAGKITGAFLTGKTWNIPESAEKPTGKSGISNISQTLPERLKEEKKSGLRGGIYHNIQIDLTYNSNHIEGSRLTHDQTRYIFETNTVGAENGAVRVDDIVETANHFKCVDMIIDALAYAPSETFIKQLHLTLKNGTTDSRLDAEQMKKLLAEYNAKKEKTFDDLLDFHYRFERIHPFQDGNGRIGRLLLFKECLQNDIVPFIIDDDKKFFYYRGLAEWQNERGFLRDTCFAAQDDFKVTLDYFGIQYWMK